MTNQPETAAERAARLRYEYEERAAILEYDSGFARQEAERRARAEVQLNDPS